MTESELVKLVEEAEKMYCDYCNISADDFEKKYDGSSVVAVLGRYHDALQALKKDLPEFGGKK